MDARWMLSRSVRVSLVTALGAAGSVHALDEQTRTQQRPLDLALPRSFDMSAEVRMRNAEQERLQIGAQRRMPDSRMQKPYGAGYEMRLSGASSAPARAPATRADAAPEASATGARGLAAAPRHGGGRGDR